MPYVCNAIKWELTVWVLIFKLLGHAELSLISIFKNQKIYYLKISIFYFAGEVFWAHTTDSMCLAYMSTHDNEPMVGTVLLPFKLVDVFIDILLLL